MGTQFIALEEICIATPCRADWDKMQGDDKSRFCGSCAKNVYNLSSMTRLEAETLIREKEGQLCVRFFQRADGTMLTTNCPVGTKNPRRRGRVSVALLTILAAPFLMVSAALAGTHSVKSNLVDSLRNTPVVGVLVNKLSPQPLSTMTGAVAVVPRTPSPTRGKPKVNAPKKSKTGKARLTQLMMGEPTMGAPLPPKVKCLPK